MRKNGLKKIEKCIIIKGNLYLVHFKKAEEVLLSDLMKTKKEEKKMPSSTIVRDIFKDCVDYLIYLFTINQNNKYSCTKTKIGKIMSIIIFKVLVSDEALDQEKEYFKNNVSISRYDKNQNCGTKIDLLNRYIDILSEYESFGFGENNSIVIELSSIETKEAQDKAQELQINSKIKELIDQTFALYASKNTKFIGNEISVLLNEISAFNDDGSVNYEKIISNKKRIDSYFKK